MTYTDAPQDRTPQQPSPQAGVPEHCTGGAGPPLYLTGERTLPGIEAETYWFCRHLAGYRWAASALTEAGGPSARVLDSGCGEGYGTALLAERTALAAGIDVFADAALHAALEYSGSPAGPRFLCADATRLPFAPDTFDAVVSLQVVEHLADPDAYVAECVRVLRDGGLLLLATPNRVTFTPPGRPRNPFHVFEFDCPDLSELVRPHVSTVRVRGLCDRHPGLADALVDAAFAGQDPPPWARDAVPEVRPEDFYVHPDPGASLDLLAWCRK